MGTLLIKNVRRNGKPCDLYIKDGVIMRTETGNPADADTILDGGGMTVLPAFVNMHTHSAMTLFRGICKDMPLKQWLDAVWKAEALLDEDLIYWGTRLACLEMIRNGTAAFADMYWMPERAAEAVGESGLRALLTYCLLDGGDAGKQERQREECMRLYEKSLGWPSRLRFGVSVHAHYTVSEDNMLWASDFARQHSLLIHTHLSETRSENDAHMERYGVSPVRRLYDMGLLGRDVIAAHALWLSDQDVSLLGSSGTTVVHNVNSNLKLASGYMFRYNELRDAGANVSMGTDGCGSSDNLDLREAMKTAALLQKGWREDPTAFPVDELLAAGTLNGYRALRLGGGVIEEGRPADLILVDTSSEAFIPDYDFGSDFIYSANSSCIDTLVCDGCVLMHGRKVAGEEETLAGAREASERFMRKINSIK
ncbi:MAG TPA: amidohydrolase [Candidatus Coprenecus stercoravium]|uniref:Amidohydrolase n=1 Tax=Candidatus Coprenecus stercoravium TaxID=2840735 RepID=A0A9D2GPW2_9BACT|nr:amidohydrolase [Candidatus Coprenecus stercoravium]